MHIITLTHIEIYTVAFSGSGRYLFSGYENNTCIGWDMLGDTNTPAISLTGHSSKITCVGVNPTGESLCTSSIDASLKVSSEREELILIYLFTASELNYDLFINF